MKYRSDIDGLRAVAVTLVIVNHALPELLPSGFLGVDVFFVISGYLITGILANDLKDSRFSIAKFYERRARRIIPALLIVVGSCIPFAYITLNPLELQKFSQSLLATLLFVPNIFFWKTVSYFDPSAETIPLLHTWSLGIEEQFYLLFPPILAYFWKKSRHAALFAVLVMAVASLATAQHLWGEGKGSASFYLPLSRAWELLVGAAVALWKMETGGPTYRARTHDGLSYLGAMTLGASLYFFDKSVPVPSLYAAAPVLATALILGFNGPSSLVYKALSLGPMVAIGMVSYSAYLWHQPLFAFVRLRGVELSSATLLFTILALAILSYVTWKFVETPFRSEARISKESLKKICIGGFMAIFGCGAIGTATGGLLDRLNEDQKVLLASSDKNLQGQYVEALAKKLNGKSFLHNGKPKVLIIGDSYGQDFLNLTSEAGVLNKLDISFFYISGDCQPHPVVGAIEKNVDLKHHSACAGRRAALSTLPQVSEADLVVVASYWRPWGAQVAGHAKSHFMNAGAKRVIFAGMKEYGKPRINDWLYIPEKLRTEISTIESHLVESRNAELELAVGKNSLQAVNSANCKSGYCRAFTKSAELISFDGAHLTKAGAHEVGNSVWASPPLSDWLLEQENIPNKQ